MPAKRPTTLMPSDAEWRRFADGNVHRLKRGKDFDVELRTVQEEATHAATRMGLGVRTLRDDFGRNNQYLWVQFADQELERGAPCRCGGTTFLQVHDHVVRCTGCGSSATLRPPRRRASAAPPPPAEDLAGLSAGESWRIRRQHALPQEYRGAALKKLPEDLAVYERLILASRAQVVVRLGPPDDGSAPWFRDRLHALHDGDAGSPAVVVVDSPWPPELDPPDVEQLDDEIVLVRGRAPEPAVVQAVRDAMSSHDRCLVLHDAASGVATNYDSVLAALRAYAPFVPSGCFFVVEHAYVDIQELRVFPSSPRGIKLAVDAWLGSPEGARFRRRPDLEGGVMCSMHAGILEAVA